jgi:hypothetical protein
VGGGIRVRLDGRRVFQGKTVSFPQAWSVTDSLIVLATCCQGIEVQALMLRLDAKVVAFERL